MAMCEFLFRGETDNEWVYGDLCHMWDGDLAIRKDGDNFPYRIITETAGPYTGLTDKNDTKIFEGDILQSRASEIQSEWKYWKVEYIDGSFVFHSDTIYRKKHKYEENLLCADNIELYGLYVVGNIYDDPELLKGA